MSLEAMEKGIRWEFQSFAEYLDALDRRGLARQRGRHGGALGRASVRDGRRGVGARGHPEEIEGMAHEVRVAMAVGAVGFSSTTNHNHVGAKGRPVPSRLATDEEMNDLAAAMGDSGRGVMEITIGARGPIAWPRSTAS